MLSRESTVQPLVQLLSSSFEIRDGEKNEGIDDKSERKNAQKCPIDSLNISPLTSSSPY
jgi:hypothetical protein